MTRLPAAISGSYLRKFAAVTIVTLLLVGGTAAFADAQVSQTLQGQTEATMAGSAAVQADILSTWEDQTEQSTRMLSDMEEITSGDPVAVDAKLNRELDRLPDTTHSIHYVNLENREIVRSTDDSMTGSSLSEIAWNDGDLQFDDNNAVHKSDGYERDSTKLMAFVSPVEGTDTAIVVTVDLVRESEQLAALYDGETVVVDDDGEVILATDEERILTRFESRTGGGALATARSGEEIIAEDSDTLASYAPISGLGDAQWTLVQRAPQANAFALTTVVRTWLGAVAGVALLGLLFIGATLGRNTAGALDDLADRASEIAAGSVDVEVVDEGRTDEIGDVRAAFRDVTDYIGTAADQADAVANREFDAAALDREVPGTLGESLDRMATDLEELLAEIEETNEALEAAAASYGAGMERAAEGDFTVRLDTAVDNEEMARIAEEFNGMMGELEATIGRVEEVAAAVAAASEDADAGVTEVERAAAEVAESVGEISAGADEQAQHVQDVTGEMSDLSAAVEEVASTADQVAARSREAADEGERGATLADDALTEMDRIQEETRETAEIVRSLDDEVGEIGEIVELIDGIAEQTNTLALNASIEAARADAEGDGFAVVADEVKQLATETREATRRIAGLVEDVQSATGEAVTDIERTRDRVGDGAETVESGLEALTDVVETVEAANDGVQSISTAAGDQAASAEEVVTMTDEVATLSEETAAEAQTVSAAAEEQSASLSQVSEEIERLAGRADDLRRLTDEFETAGGATVDGTSPDQGRAATDGGTD